MSGFHGPDLGPFQWDDPLLLEAQLTEDERMIRDTARDFAAKGARAPDRKGLPRREGRPASSSSDGRSGAARGDAAGGIRLRAGYVAYGLVAREIERVNSGFRSTMSVQSSLVMYPIHAYGDADQRR